MSIQLFGTFFQGDKSASAPHEKSLIFYRGVMDSKDHLSYEPFWCPIEIDSLLIETPVII